MNKYILVPVYGTLRPVFINHIVSIWENHPNTDRRETKIQTVSDVIETSMTQEEVLRLIDAAETN